MTYDESGVYARGQGLAHYLSHDDFPGFLFKSAPDDGVVLYDHLYPMLLYFLNPSRNLAYDHWLNLFFALLVFICAFEVLLWQTGKPWLALAGPLFLFLTPRFLGDIPANPKDMPFAVFYFLALAGIFFFSLRPKAGPLVKAPVLGLLFGLAQCSRLLGFTLYGVYLLLDLHFYYHDRPRRPLRDWGRHLLAEAGTLFLVFSVSNLLMVATWPYLGANYFRHLGGLLSLARDFHWENNVLFWGKSVLSTQLPWTYLPVWFLLTTPLFLLFALGALCLSPGKWLRNRLFILLASALGLNLFLDLALRPVLYDGLRHFLFLLPILAVLASLPAVEFLGAFRPSAVKITLLALCLLNGLGVCVQMARLHPYEYVYFNELIGGLKGAAGKFDTDYWGASFKEAVEWLRADTAQDGRKTYKVTGSGNPYQIFYYFPNNFKWVDDLKDADFYVSYTRDGKHLAVDPSKVIHVVEREGVPLNYVFKLK